MHCSENLQKEIVALHAETK